MKVEANTSFLGQILRECFNTNIHAIIGMKFTDYLADLSDIISYNGRYYSIIEDSDIDDNIDSSIIKMFTKRIDLVEKIPKKINKK